MHLGITTLVHTPKAAIVGLSLIGLPSLVAAQYEGPGRVEIRSSVGDVLLKPTAGQLVIIEGRLSKRVADGEFVFTDGTGDIPVRIDPSQMRGSQITDSSMIEIRGRVAIDFRSRPSIDVVRIVVMAL